MHKEFFSFPNLLLATVVVPTLLFGAVEPWALVITGILVATTFVVFAWHLEGHALRDAKPLLFCASALVAYGLFQLTPLPLSIIGWLHSSLAQLISLPAAAASDGSGLAIQVPAVHSISVYPFATEMELSRLAMYLMVFLAASFGIQSREEIYRMVRILAIFGFAVALFALAQKALWNDKLYWFREISGRGNPFGPFVNKNHFAGWMAMVAPLAFSVLLLSRSHDRRILYGFFALVMSITIFFSLSRSGIVSFFAGALTLGCITFWTTPSRKRLLPVFVFLGALLAHLLYLGVNPIIQRFTQADLTQNERFTVWQASITAFRDFPIFGAGLGTYQYVFPAYKPLGIRMFYQHAHNDYVELLVELGAIGVALLVLLLFTAGQTILRGEWDERESYLKAGFVASLVSMAVFSIFDFNLHIPSNAILFSLIAGMAVAFNRTGHERRRHA